MTKVTISRRAVAASLALAPIPALAAAANDPVFVKIAALQDAHAAHHRCIGATDRVQVEHGHASPEYAAADALQDVAADAELDAFRDFLATAPTSKPGALAYLAMLLSPAGWGEADGAIHIAPDSDDVEAVIASLRGYIEGAP